MRRLSLLLALAACGDDAPTTPDATMLPDGVPPAGCVPSSGWLDLPPLANGPTQETATVALDRKIYVVGGFRGTTVLDTVQVFDTEACTWTNGPALPRPVHHANVVVVGDTLWVVGAMEGLNFATHPHVWSWAPATETAWTSHAAMPNPRGSSVAGVIDGTIVIAGGLRNGAVPEVSSFDPVAGTWATLPALPVARDHGCGGVVGDTLYVTGGRATSIGSTSGTVYAYTPGGSWVPKAAMPTARGGTACAVVGSAIYVLGGEGNPADASGVFPQVEAYDTVTDTWTTLAPMPHPRHGMAAAAWDGSIYVPGGADVEAFGAVATHDVLTP